MININPYIIFKGAHSKNYKLIVEKFPSRKRAEKSIERVEVPGRSGALYVDNNSFKTVTKTVEFALLDDEFIDPISRLFTGEGNLILLNEPNRYYEAIVKNVIEFKTIIKQYDYIKYKTYNRIRFIVDFECQPFSYSTNEKNDIITLISQGKFKGKGTWYSEPIITVFGSGNISLTINNITISLSSVSDYITIDSSIKYTHKDNIALNNKMVGEFPTLAIDENNISWSGNVSKVVINPRWRWLV